MDRAKVALNSTTLFRDRIKRLTESWTWSLDALLILTGKRNEDAPERKSQAMQLWLLGVEFPETVMLLLRSGKVVFLSSVQKVEYLQAMAGPDVVLMTRKSAAGSGVDVEQVKQLAALVHEGKEKATIGMVQKEKHVGPFAEAFQQALVALPQVVIEDCREEVSTLLAPKDAEEMELTRKAALAAEHIMKDLFIPKLEEIIDMDVRKKNEDVCNELETALDDEELIMRRNAQLPQDKALDPKEIELVSVSLQSGKQFELKPSAFSNTDTIPMEGTYLLCLGVQYTSYSAMLSRTLLVNPTPKQKEAYNVLLAIQQKAIASATPGAAFKDLFLAARGTVEERQPDMVDCFTKSIGFVTGLEFKDVQQTLNDKSERKVVPGMVLCISCGFHITSPAPWALWLTDTVIVPVEGGESEVITKGCSSSPANVMFELDEDGPPDAPPQAAAASTAPPPGPKAKAPPQPKSKAAAAPRAKSPPKAKSAAKAAAKRGGGAAAAAADRPPARAAARETRKPAVTAGPPDGRRRAAAAAAEVTKQRAPPRHSSRVPDDMIRGAKIMQTRTRSKNAQTKQDLSELAKIEEVQLELREKKLEEIRGRFLGKKARKDNGVPNGVGGALSDCCAFASPDLMPAKMRDRRVQLETGADALLVPLFGSIVPFHFRVIKNMSRLSGDAAEFLRVNFFCPGQGKNADDFPLVNGRRLYLKELTFRSETKENFDQVLRSFKDAQKRAKQREVESSTHTAAADAPLEPLQTIRSPPSLRDLHMRPIPSSSSRRTEVNLEAHANGFRFLIKGSTERIDVLYSQVRHAVFEPCENSLIILLHLHLRHPMMLGKRRTQDIQVFTEVAPLTEDLSKAAGTSAHDPDEILDEQRDNEMKDKLNKLFLMFAKKVEGIPTCPFKFDIPLKELAFNGVASKSVVTLNPCKEVLAALQEWPPFVLTLSEIDVVVFEREDLQLREFDMVFVRRDYEKLPIRITTIPKKNLPDIKRWLHGMKTPWYSCTMNMQWPLVMKEINKDLSKFASDGGWDAWFSQHSSDESGDEEDFEGGGGGDNGKAQQGGRGRGGRGGGRGRKQRAQGGDDSESDFECDEDEADDSSDASMGPEAEDSSDSAADEEDEGGLSWDELDREAEEADRKKDIEERAAARRGGAGGGGASGATRPQSRPPPAKRTKR